MCQPRVYLIKYRLNYLYKFPELFNQIFETADSCSGTSASLLNKKKGYEMQAAYFFLNQM